MILILTGCKAEGDSVFDYREHDASFSAVFSSSDVSSEETDDVICSVTKAGGDICMTVVSPARSAGVKITYDSKNVTVSAGNVTIPLSDRASAGIRNLFDLLYPVSDIQWTLKRSDDGRETYLISKDGQITLGEDLLPRSAKVNGREKSVEIREYVIIRKK